MIKKLINNFRNPEKVFGTGGLFEEPSARDYNHEEVVAKTTPIKWIEKSMSKWRTFPKFHQNGSSSCVGQTVAKMLGVENFLEEGKFVHFSAKDIYSRGYVENGGGMYGRDAMKIGKEHGATLEQLIPSQMLSETEMRVDNSTILSDQIALVGKGGDYISITNPRDFDLIASILKTGKAVGGGISYNDGGFTNGEVKLAIGGKYRHWITYVDYTIYKGQKALIFDNSWGTGWGLNKGQGVITENQSWGIYSNWYFKNLRNDWRDNKKIEKPCYTFSTTLKVGDNNSDVIALQNILKYEKLFPNNIESTGYFGGITAKAVYDFQVKYKIASQEELDKLAGTIVGPKTREKLNKLYSK